MSHFFNKQKMVDYYEQLLSQHGDHYLSLDWKTPESQKVRFNVFMDALFYGQKKEKVTFLDVGCGFGDLYGFLRDNKYLNEYKISYTGYDISEKIIDRAKIKYKEARFEVKDILMPGKLPRFDYLFASGVFNISLEDSAGHMEYVRNMIKRMYELSNCGVGANFLSANAYYFVLDEETRKNQYYYFKPEDIISFTRYLTNRFVLRHDYHAGDFTVFLLK